MRALFFALLLCGCLPTTYVCYDDAECVSDGKPGVCTPARACAFSVTVDVCPSQLRYAHASPATLADTCYLPDFCAVTPPSGQTFCDGLSVFECQDFESDSAFTTWQPTTSEGSAAVLDTMRACRGKSSAKLTLSTTGPPASTSLNYVPPASQNLPDPIYGRAFYYFASPLPLLFNNVAIFTFEDGGSGDGTQLVLENDTLAVNNYPGGKAANIQPSDLTVPADAWVCLELEVSLANGTINVWFDGNAVPSLALEKVKNGLTFPATMNGASVSYAFATTPSTSEMFTAWVDDVILDSKRIGCTQ